MRDSHIFYSNRHYTSITMINQIVILCLISMSAANPAYQATGSRNSYDPTYGPKPQPYSFNFDVREQYGTVLNRQEQGDDQGNKIGSYGFANSNGISRQVEYIADDQGFRAVIKTNEPGTSNESPAAVEMQVIPLQYQSSRNTETSYGESYAQGSGSVKLASKSYRVTPLVIKQQTPLDRPLAISTKLVSAANEGVSINAVQTPFYRFGPILAKLTPTANDDISARRVHQASPYTPQAVSAKLATPSGSEIYRVQNPSYVQRTISGESIPTAYRSNTDGLDLSSKSGFSSVSFPLPTNKIAFGNVQASPYSYGPFAASAKLATTTSNVY